MDSNYYLVTMHMFTCLYNSFSICSWYELSHRISLAKAPEQDVKSKPLNFRIGSLGIQLP